jgi:hypothetical protein
LLKANDDGNYLVLNKPDCQYFFLTGLVLGIVLDAGKKTGETLSPVWENARNCTRFYRVIPV